MIAGTTGTTPPAGEAAGDATGVAGEASAVAFRLVAGVAPKPETGVEAVPVDGEDSEAEPVVGVDTDAEVGLATVTGWVVGTVVGATTAALAVGVSSFLSLPPPQLTRTSVLKPRANTP